jgi:hypothetical protein
MRKKHNFQADIDDINEVIVPSKESKNKRKQ